MSLKVKFLGAVGTVTGSCSLLHYEVTDSYYLVDCGLYQGSPGDDERNQRKFFFDPSRISIVFLTHAHIDHCGLIPRLVAEGFKGKVICTRATARFTMIALEDSARRGDQPYSSQDVRNLEAMFQCPDDDDNFRFGHFYPVDQDFLFGFIRTAHIVGSVAIEFRVNISTSESLTIVFSGDIGPCADEGTHGGLQKRRQYPNPKMSYLVCESTYGGRVREASNGTFEGRTRALAQMLERAFARGNDPTVIIPSFSLQRAQDLVVDLFYALEHLVAPWNPDLIPCVYVDSGMAREHSQIMCEELQRIGANGKHRFLNTKSPLLANLNNEEIHSALGRWLDPSAEGIQTRIDGCKWRLSYTQFNQNDHPSHPKIVIASAGNCLGGRVVKHLANNVENPAATIAFSGYLPSASPGFALKSLVGELSDEQRERVKIKLGDREFSATDVKATVEDLSSYYSGHADEAGLVDFILRKDTPKPTSPLRIFLNHGDRRARTALKQRLEEVAKDSSGSHRSLEEVFLPEAKDGWFNLVTDKWEQSGVPADISDRMDELDRKLDEVLANQEKILALLKANPAC